MKKILLTTGFLLLFAAEILRVYFIMPFPGSQQANTIGFAYWLSKNIFWIRILALLLLAYPVCETFLTGKRTGKVTTGCLLGLYLLIFLLFNFRLEADKMFYQPKQKILAAAKASKIAEDKLVIGIILNGEAKAYPIQLIGYHHQVQDTVGGLPVMVTYCTVCRTGRVFNPVVNGKTEKFRLVGMDHFNAMFEDESTGSWWQQATGEAIRGPLKGAALAEYPSRQLTLASWLRQYPTSKIMQPDKSFNDEYKDLAKYDKGIGKSNLTKRDSASWKPKSWVLGIAYKGSAKAIDWNLLAKKSLVSDSLPGLPYLVFLEKDSSSFHVWDRRIGDQNLTFQSDAKGILTDEQTKSVWNTDGICISGPLKGRQLQNVQAYQEFWHSWKNFHPATTVL